MKCRIAAVLSALLLIAAPAFADVTVSGDFAFGFNTSTDEYEPVFDDGSLVFKGTSASGNATAVFGLDFTVLPSTEETTVPMDFISDLYMTFDLMGAMNADIPVGAELLCRCLWIFRSRYG